MSALVVGQFGGPTPVINGSLAGVIAASQATTAVTAIYGLRHGFEGVLREQPMLDLSELPAATLARLAHTPAAALGSSRYRLQEADYGRILDAFATQGVRFFVPIGGNGSMYVANRLAETAVAMGMPLQIMGVPKTIDNDLVGVDHCPGYGSAARFLAMAVRDTGRDLAAMATFDDVTILEVMGRNTGWLAAATLLAKEKPTDAPHLIYVPEQPFDEAQFLADVKRVHAQLGAVFVVVSEGIRDGEGVFVGARQLSVHRDVLGRTIHSLSHGVASYLSDRVITELGLQSRFLRPGLVGRALSACVSEVDRAEARWVGETAVRQLMAGRSGEMVTLVRTGDEPYGCQTDVVALATVAGAERPLVPHYVDVQGNMITEAFRAYGKPLIGAPLVDYVQL